MGFLTTHALDLVAGQPARGLALTLSALDGDSVRRLVETITNADGRTDAPLLEGARFTPGIYQIEFHVGAFFAGTAAASGIRFLDIVPLRFGVDDASGHYHVPLLVTPWSYSTYRGS